MASTRSASSSVAATISCVGRHVIFYVVQYWGAIDYHLARLAAVAGDYDEALAHFARALDQHRRSGGRGFEVMTLRALATIMYFRNRDSDRTDAAEFHRQARALAAHIGMPHLIDPPWPPLAPLDLAHTIDRRRLPGS